MIKRMLAFTSSVFFAAGTTPWPIPTTHHVPQQRNTRDNSKSPSTDLQAAAVSNRNRRTYPMSLDFFRETLRLQEIHFAVTKESMVPVWQDPRAGNFQQRIKQEKVQLKSRISSQTSKKNPSAPRPLPLSARSSESVIHRTLADDVGLRISAVALSLVGRPYRWGGESPSGFDCSGLMQYAYRQAGIYIPRTSYEQARVGVAVGQDALRPGDLVFFSAAGPGASHVALYVGNGLIVQALNEGTGVIVSHLNASYFQRHFCCARRVV